MSDLDAGAGSALRPDGGPAVRSAVEHGGPEHAGPEHAGPGHGGDSSVPLDLDAIERDLRDVESALARLADGTYFPHPVARVPGTTATGSTIDSSANAAADAGMDV